jgi:predicted RNA-binding Zn-ribbon protein involved in translation (DUF1610 family)
LKNTKGSNVTSFLFLYFILDDVSSWTMSSEDLLLLNPDGSPGKSGVCIAQNISSDLIFDALYQGQNVHPSQRGSAEAGRRVDYTAQRNWLAAGGECAVSVYSAVSDKKQAETSTNESSGFRCPRCGKVYRWKKSLNLHMKYECGTEPKFQCPYCFVKAKRKWSLKQHILGKHQQNAAAFL